MAESACLWRSVSDLTDISSIAKEGDPICAKLGESISFGRFMSETLAWEKWSAFSHNRYVEEAEKFSRPGSVAEKKAYFEAHYRKKSAERAAALIQEANDAANITFDSETHDRTCNNSSIEIKSKSESNETVNKQPGGDAVNFIVVDRADRNKYKYGIEQSEVEISRVEISEDVSDPRVDTNPSVENSSLVDNSNQFDNVEVHHEKIAIPNEERMPDLGNASQEIQALSVRRREVNLPSKTAAATLSYSPAERKAAVQAKDKINSALRNKKSVGDSVEKKRLTARSLHMSINLASCAGLRSRTTSVSELNRIKKINPNLPKILKGALNEASSNPHFEGRSCLKSSSSTRTNPRSPTISSPFKFRSEERAAKRKEFFQRIDAIKSQEAEKVQVQKRCKENTQHGHKKLRQNSGSKSKLNEDINNVLRSPSQQMRKIPVTIPRSSNIQIIKVPVTPPRSPSLGRKARSKTVQDRSCQNYGKPPNPVTSLARKITRENASPNIQH